MQNNSNTHTENLALDAEDWEIALEPYQGNHRAARIHTNDAENASRRANHQVPTSYRSP